ncbi:MAG TPA: endonuclease/exonuclease/phosphatase family protein [Candidatus Saccharimonadia bacterium]|nr:endonuclease/exonuclease/phosphatase family protein [Candidatus Saccharimonadia bacterium]
MLNGQRRVVGAGFIDVFRELEKGAPHYSWWSYHANARANNVGWRIDYWLMSGALRPKLKAARIRSEILGSDHCPVELELK